MLPKRRYRTSATSGSLVLIWPGGQAGGEHVLLSRPVGLVPGEKHYSCLLYQFLSTKDTSDFSNRLNQTCLLQSKVMDKSWREKSSLMYCSVRVKHSTAILQAAIQEQNVIVSSQDQTSANLGNIRKSWISFHAGTRLPQHQSSPQHHRAPCEEKTRCMGLHGATAPLAEVLAWGVGTWDLPPPAARTSHWD